MLEIHTVSLRLNEIEHSLTLRQKFEVGSCPHSVTVGTYA